MPEPYLLLSAESMSAETYRRLLTAAGAVWEQDRPAAGRLSDGEKHVWISPADEELKNYDPDELSAIRKALGGTPRSCLLLDVSDTAGSEHLAIRFAAAVLHERRVVIDDLRGRLLSDGEIFERHRTDRGLQGET